MKKGVKMVNTCFLHFTIGSQTPPNNTRHIMDTHIHHLHTFLHTGSGLYNPLQHARIVPRPHILYNISTTLYSLQLYSISTVYNLYNTPLAFAYESLVR